MVIIIYELQNIGEEEKDEAKKEDLVKDVLDPKTKTHPKIKIMISKNQNEESLSELTEKKNVTQEPRQQRKKKPAEVRRSPYKERVICLKRKLTKKKRKCLVNGCSICKEVYSKLLIFD